MKKDVYETAFDAVKAAAHAYRRGEPGNRQMLKFAAIDAINCRIEEAETRDAGAIIDLVWLAKRILETTESVILDDRNPNDREMLHDLLTGEMQGYAWLPVLMAPGGKTVGKKLLESLAVGAAFPLNPKSKWSLETPMNRLAIRALQITENVLARARFGDDALKSAYPSLTLEQRNGLLTVVKERNKLKALSKANCAQWVNKVLIPVILAIDPELETIPEAKQVLDSAKVKKNGAKPAYFRSELSKYLGEYLPKLVK
jgi:hypothetical protein